MVPTRTSRADLHCHSTASHESRLGIQTRPRPARVRHPSRRGLRAGQAARDGLRDDHRPRHDRRRARDRRPPGRVHLRGADRRLQGRATGRARPVPAASPPATTSGCRPTTTTSRPAPSTCTATRSRARWPIPSMRWPRRSPPRHRRRLARLFPVWETRNGSRAKELNMPAAIYIETHGGTGVGGSDDHAGVDIGRTFTETPPASTPEEFLRRIRRGEAERARRPGQRGQVGALGDGARRALARAAARARPRPTRGR